MSKIKLGLVFGGKSAEHEVSIMSAESVFKAIDKEKYEVTLFYITKQGIWTKSDEIKYKESSEKLPISPEIICYLYEQDIILPIIHGPHGEDGSLQGFFESLEIPYIGSNVLASAVCMDKIISKKISKQAGINVARFYEVYDEINDDTLSGLLKWIDEVKYPVFVKPSNMGSSVGISKVSDDKTLSKALIEALKYDSRIIIEEGINAREIECAILEHGDVIISGVGEVVATDDFYDYTSKYVDDGNEKMQIPAKNISNELVVEIQEIAEKAFKEHGCSGLCRIDFFVEHETNKIILNELNTLPGMTAFSMFPSLFEYDKISYSELIDKMIKNVIDHK